MRARAPSSQAVWHTHKPPSIGPAPAVNLWEIDGRAHVPVTPQLLASFGLATEGGSAAAPDTLESMLLGVLPGSQEGETPLLLPLLPLLPRFPCVAGGLGKLLLGDCGRQRSVQ